MNPEDERDRSRAAARARDDERRSPTEREETVDENLGVHRDAASHSAGRLSVVEQRDAEEDEEIRRESPEWVDLWEIDAVYARLAAHGMADTTAKNAAVDAAVQQAAMRRGGHARAAPGRSTHRDRARAAQRWEQNREYVESRHENVDRRQ